MDETFVITGSVVAEESALAARQSLSVETVEALAPRTLADLTRFAPSANLRTNSRGETLVFLRGAGERETALFLDGAPLNVPWDNRVDLQLLPAGVAAGVSVVSGPVSARYGARSSGGAVELESYRSEAIIGQLRAEGGSENAYLLNGVGAGRAGGLRWSAAVGRQARDGLPLADADGERVAFSQVDPDRRTNTDLALTNGFARLSGRVGEWGFAGSLLIAEGAQGVAPESDRDPNEDRVRFWRYPDTAFRLVSASIEREHPHGETRWLGWAQVFDQAIESFASDAYAVVEDLEQDENLTLGGRATHRHVFGGSVVTLSASGHVSSHRQEDRAFDEAGVTLDETRQTFREGLVVLGVEAETPLTSNLDLALSASVDRLAVLEAEGDASVDPFLDVSFGAGLSWRVAPSWTLRAAAGRRPRQPTLRELFGRGVNRFAPNPDLVSERSWAAEAGVEWRGDERLRVESTAFLRETTDALAQRVIEIDGESARQRINAAGARVIGVEIVAEGEASRRLSWRGQLTWQRARDDMGAVLPERPRLLARGWADYATPFGVALRAELEHVGEAFSPDADDQLQPLDSATMLNLQSYWRPKSVWPGAPDFTLYVRVDNTTNAFLEPQIGLPAPGRQIRGGVRATL